MIAKVCIWILNKMRKEMPEITDEKAEEIQYGLELIIGEMPKMILLVGVSFLLGIGWYMIFAYIVLIPYKMMVGGFHLHTHLGCIIGSAIFYYGNIFLSKFILLDNIQKYILVASTLVFGILMISLYAPADTENVPIISKKERKTKKIFSYIFLTITLGISLLIPNQVLSNILIFGIILQTLTITRIAYKLTKNKYGHEVYLQESN